MIPGEAKKSMPPSAELRLVRWHIAFAKRTSRRSQSHGSVERLWRYGIGGFGTGATPQIADAHGGRGGVGISSPFPCVDGEQLGSVVGLQNMQLPVKVSLFG